MRIAVSVPDWLSKKVDRLARSSGRSRSELASAALAEYIDRHYAEEVTAAMDRLSVETGEHPDTFVVDAGRRVLAKTEW